MWYNLTTVKNSDGSFTFTTCSPNGEQGYYGGYFYVLKPSGGLLGKVDIPKGQCRTDRIAASNFTESGKYMAIVADYNGFHWVEQDIYPATPYFGYEPPKVRKTLITNLTSNETLISAAVMFETGTGLLTRPRFIRKYQVSEGYAFEYEFPSDTSWTQFIAVSATTSGGAGLAKFVTKNAGKIALLIASVFSFVIIWKWLDVKSQQIEIQAKISDNTKDSITKILTDPTIPAVDKAKVIELILKGASGVTPTNWSSTITTGVIIIAGAYIVSEVIKNKKKEK